MRAAAHCTIQTSFHDAQRSAALAAEDRWESACRERPCVGDLRLPARANRESVCWRSCPRRGPPPVAQMIAGSLYWEATWIAGVASAGSCVDVHIGRISPDLASDSGLLCWCVRGNVRMEAAANRVPLGLLERSGCWSVRAAERSGVRGCSVARTGLARREGGATRALSTMALAASSGTRGSSAEPLLDCP